MSGNTIRKSSRAKPATRKPRSTPKPKAAPVSATDTPDLPAAKTAKPVVAPKSQPVVLGPKLRKKELIDRVVARSGIKKKDAKPVIEAVLAELGLALVENRELSLQPMGQIKIKRERDLPKARILTAKIRQPARVRPKPFADAAE